MRESLQIRAGKTVVVLIAITIVFFIFASLVSGIVFLITSAAAGDIWLAGGGLFCALSAGVGIHLLNYYIDQNNS